MLLGLEKYTVKDFINFAACPVKEVKNTPVRPLHIDIHLLRCRVSKALQVYELLESFRTRLEIK